MSNSALVPELLPISHIHQETADVFSMTLDASSRGGFCFQPGQFNMLYVFGAGEVPISIAGDPAQTQLIFHTVRAVGRVTRAMAKLEAGQCVGVRGPFGQGWPIAAARGKHLVIVAGGIGLAPLRPVILQVLSERASFGRVSVIYGARTPQDLLYLSELEGYRARGVLDVDIIVDRGDPGWSGHTGVVTKLIRPHVRQPSGTLAMLCGPEVMMRFAARELNAVGLRNDQIYLSLERNMQCGVGLCGHCQLGRYLLCRDGATFRYDQVLPELNVREL